MSDILKIGMGELLLASAPTVVETDGVGSCIAVCLYCALKKAGAMAHIMLPKQAGQMDINNTFNYRYADVAIHAMIAKLEEQGIAQATLTAKIAGGSNMFPDVQGRSHKIGEKNIESVHEVLNALKIPILSEHTGGSVGRTVLFNLGNGIVSIQSNI